jgi:hypothetical protein
MVFRASGRLQIDPEDLDEEDAILQQILYQPWWDGAARLPRVPGSAYRGDFRKSNVKGASGLRSSFGTTTRLGVWPKGTKRATRRLSAS